MRVMEAVRGSKGTLVRRTLGLTSTWAQVKDRKRGEKDGGRQARLARGTPLGRLAWEGSTDEQWRLAGESAVQANGRSATGQERGEEEVGSKRY